MILGVSGCRRLDFATLLRAFARLRRQRPCRLLILGEDRRRERLFRVAAELGIADDLALPGLLANPYRRCVCCRWPSALTSQGKTGIVLVGVALGTPVVAW